MSSNGGPSGPTAPPPAENVTEFKVRIPEKNESKSFHIMKFNSSLKQDPTKWKQVRMVRENNKRVQAQQEEEMPKFGAGSEFGREEKEAARRKKYGKPKVYDPEAQPWLMRIGTKKEGKTYRGLREGGVNENASYYVFTHAPDGSFEAHPVKQWYNFTPRINYKTIDAEEAEERFAERGKILNHWAIMVNKRLKPGGEQNDDDIDGEGGSSKGSKGTKGAGDLKISDMDDWVDSGDGLDSDEDDDEDAGSKKKKKKKDEEEQGNKRSKDSKKKNRKKEEAEIEGNEDSDDGDDEGREVDYMSDESSDSEQEQLEINDAKGVDQDEGLQKMLDSDSSSEDEDKKDDGDDEDDDKPGKKKGEEGEDEEKEGKKKGKKGGKGSKNSSRAATPTPDDDKGTKEGREKASKRKALVEDVMDLNSEGTPAKKSRLDALASGSSQGTSASSSNGAVSAVEASFEEDVRRYLARKPMTTTEILKKFKSKKTGLNKDELMPLLVNVLKRINPHKQKVKGIMYLSLKDQKK